MKRTEKEIADANLYLMQNLSMPRGWTERMGRWAYNSLRETKQKFRKSLQVKLDSLRKAEKEKRKVPQDGKMGSAKRKVVYNNSSKKLTEEQLEVLALGLNFGITPKKFPLVEYIQAAELLCQKLEEGEDTESVEKARSIRNVVFQHLKKGKR